MAESVPWVSSKWSKSAQAKHPPCKETKTDDSEGTKWRLWTYMLLLWLKLRNLFGQERHGLVLLATKKKRSEWTKVWYWRENLRQRNSHLTCGCRERFIASFPCNPTIAFDAQACPHQERAQVFPRLRVADINYACSRARTPLTWSYQISLDLLHKGQEPFLELSTFPLLRGHSGVFQAPTMVKWSRCKKSRQKGEPSPRRLTKGQQSSHVLMAQGQPCYTALTQTVLLLAKDSLAKKDQSN